MINIPLLFYREDGSGYAKKYRDGVKILYMFFNNETNEKLKKKWLGALSIYVQKAIIYNVLGLFGKESMLLKRRNLKLDIGQITKGQNDLKLALLSIL
jgi:hypothetical protein